MRTLQLFRGQVDLATGQGVVAERPFRLTEPQCALLSLLSDRAGEAVDRDEIRSALGAHPDAPRRVVDLAIRRLRARIEVDPSAPMHVLSVFNQGYRFQPAVGAAHGLPPERSALLGRESDLAEVRGALKRCGLVTVTGAGGVGKTALALQAARAFPSGQVVSVPAASVRTPAELASVLARALGVPTTGLSTEPAITARVLGALRERPGTLLVLDDCERALPAVVALIEAQALGAPQVIVLVTSRIVLGLPHEHVVRLGPLAPEAAEALFLARARAIDAPVRSDDPDLATLVQRLDCLPLAIELAAARARALSPGAMLARLDERFRLLTGSHADDPRHSSLRATFAWSWALLGDRAQAALIRLSSFCLPAGPEAVRQVLGPGADALVEELASSSWIRREGGSVALFESVREWALEQAEFLGLRSEAELRHARYHAALARRLRGTGPIAPEALDALDAVLPELLAVERVVDREPALAASVVLALHDRFHLRGPLGPLVALTDAVLSVPAPPFERRVHFVRGAALRILGRFEEATRALDRAARGAPLDLQGKIAAEQAMVLWETGRREASRAAFERALELPLEAEDRAITQASLANVLAALGEPDRAEALLRRSIDEGLVIGAVARVPGFRANLAAALQGQGRIDEAEALLEQALSDFELLRNEQRAATCRYTLATLRAEQGRLDDATALCDEAERTWLRFGRRRLCIYAALLRAEIQLADRSPEQALAHLDVAAERIAEAGGLPERIQEGGDRVAALALAGRRDEARTALRALDALGAPPVRLAVLEALVAAEPSRLPALDAPDGPTRFLARLCR